MEFEEVRGRLRKLSDYGDDLAGSPVDWHQHRNPDGSLGGWVQNQVFIHPGAVIEPDAIVFGKDVSLSSQTSVRGNSVVGPAVRTEGTADIDRSLVCGYSWDQHKQGLPRLVQGLGWPLDHTLIRDSSLSEAKVNASGLDNAAVFEGATLFGSGVTRSIISGNRTLVRGSLLSEGVQVVDGAQAYGSILTEGAVLSGRFTSAEHSTLSGGSQVKNGARVVDCVVGNGSVIDHPGIQRGNERIESNRYALHATPLPQSLPVQLGMEKFAGRSFPEELRHGAALVRAPRNSQTKEVEVPMRSYALAG